MTQILETGSSLYQHEFNEKHKRALIGSYGKGNSNPSMSLTATLAPQAVACLCAIALAAGAMYIAQKESKSTEGKKSIYRDRAFLALSAAL